MTGKTGNTARKGLTNEGLVSYGKGLAERLGKPFGVKEWNAQADKPCTVQNLVHRFTSLNEFKRQCGLPVVGRGRPRTNFAAPAGDLMPKILPALNGLPQTPAQVATKVDGLDRKAAQGALNREVKRSGAKSRVLTDGKGGYFLAA